MYTGEKKSILIGDMGTVDWRSKKLLEFYFNVESRYDASSVLENLSSSSHDLVIIDYVMLPGVNFLNYDRGTSELCDVSRELVLQVSENGLPVIVYGSQENESFIQGYIDKGAVAYYNGRSSLRSRDLLPLVAKHAGNL